MGLDRPLREASQQLLFENVRVQPWPLLTVRTLADGIGALIAAEGAPLPSSMVLKSCLL